MIRYFHIFGNAFGTRVNLDLAYLRVGHTFCRQIWFSLLFSGVLEVRSAGLEWGDAWKSTVLSVSFPSRRLKWSVTSSLGTYTSKKSKDASCWPRDAAKSELLFVAFGGKLGLYSKRGIQCDSSAGVTAPNSNTITYLLWQQLHWQSISGRFSQSPHYYVWMLSLKRQALANFKSITCNQSFTDPPSFRWSFTVQGWFRIVQKCQ